MSGSEAIGEGSARKTRRSLEDRDFPYISSILLASVAFLIRLGLDPWLEDRSPLLVFMPAIVIAGGRYGAGPGLLAAVYSLVLAVIFFIIPHDAFPLSADQATSIGVFVVASIAMLFFAGHLKTALDRAERLQGELHEAHTARAVETMAATLAHELSQPLAAAANYVAASRAMLAREAVGETNIESNLDEAETQIHRAGEIIRHTRDVVSNATSARRPVSLKTLVDQALRPLAASGTSRGARIAVDIDPDADRLIANPTQIGQVLLNLLRNACQATSEAPQIAVRGTAVEGATLIEVRDQGHGLCEDQLNSLFVAKGVSTSGGMGLGLSISRMIVEAHGGSIWARSHDSGASFYFTVPNQASESRSAA